MKPDQYLEKHIVDYEKRLVAFFDLQGFKDTIIGKYSCEAIGSVFGVFASFSNKLQTDYKDLEITIISDSIVISTTIEERTNIIRFFEACSFFATPKIGDEFIAVRGGIAYGNLHHANNIVFGSALIEAYNLSERQPEPKFLKTLMKKETFNVLKSNDYATMFLYSLMLPQPSDNKKQKEENTDDKYYFDCWYFPFLLSHNNVILDRHIANMKEYIFWVLNNIKCFKTFLAGCIRVREIYRHSVFFKIRQCGKFGTVVAGYGFKHLIFLA